MYLNKFYYNVIKQSNISYYENKIHIFHKTIFNNNLKLNNFKPNNFKSKINHYCLIKILSKIFFYSDDNDTGILYYIF